jgi:uncharacterized damage-inducible protein DinB
MFRKITDFEEAWKEESGNTEKIFGALTDEAAATAVSEGHRTLARMAWHIACTISEMMGQTGMKVSLNHEAPVPATVAEIQAAYKQAAAELIEQVKKNWDDESLLTEDEMYGMKWKRGLTLSILLKHEIHHRGQMTVLMRQAGLAVPGVYGPAKEEWAVIGGQPPAI